MSCQSSEDQSAHAKVSPFVSGQEANASRLPTICSIYSCLYFSSPQLLANTPTANILYNLCAIDLYLKPRSCCRRLFNNVHLTDQHHRDMILTNTLSLSATSAGKTESQSCPKGICQHILYPISEQTVNFDARPAISWPSE